MDEYSSNNSALKGMKLKALADRVDARKILREDELSRCTRVSVEGYGTCLCAEDIRKALGEHFHSCGQVYDVVIPRDPESHVLERCGFVYFREEGAQEKALALSGSDVGGWNVLVKALPKKDSAFSADQVAAARRLADSRPSGFAATGFDTRLPADDVRSALFKHFSSCGEVIYVSVSQERGTSLLHRYAFICMSGEDAVEKAMLLSGSGSDVGGWNVVAMPALKPKENIEDRPERPCG